MPRIPPDKVVQKQRENRTSQVARGIKQGVIKKTVEQLTDNITTPMAEKLAPKLASSMDGKLAAATPMLKPVLDFAFLTALAEILEYGGGSLSKVPGVKMSEDEARDKCRALAHWIRTYSGEMFGENIVEAAAEFIPVFANMLSSTDLTELLDAVDDMPMEATATDTISVSEPAYAGLE